MTSPTDVIELEAVYLDERRWEDWLSLFTEDCEYWMPTWKDDDTLAADPQTEISHIYYVSRAALEDRIVRINSKLSPASSPMPRTTHILGSMRPQDPKQGPQAGAPSDAPSDAVVGLRTAWSCHVFWPATGDAHAFFGTYEHDLVPDGDRWLIARKKIVLQNDYIPSMIDFYCL
jgi:3-phenylpropionate/cinnamic acid dioxygenase small subunit